MVSHQQPVVRFDRFAQRVRCLTGSRKIRMLAVQVSRTNGSSPVGRLRWCYGVLLYVVVVQRVVLAEHAVLVEYAAPVDDAVLVPDVGL